MRIIGLIAYAALTVGVFVPASASAQDEYREPPQEVAAILDIPPPPAASVSPDGNWAVFTTLQGMPSIADRAVPMARLAGVRVNTATNGPYDAKAYDRNSSYTGRGVEYRLVNLKTGAEHRVALDAAKLGPPMWAPDSSRFAFLYTTAKGIELWVADAVSGKVRALSGPSINVASSIASTSAGPCDWMADSRRIMCQFIPENRGPAPERGVPTGPSVQQTDGKKAPVWTFTNLLTDKYDEQLFDYYMTSQPMIVDVVSGKKTPFAKAGIYESLKPSEDGRYYLSTRIVGPYSYLVPASRFPKQVEILSADGSVVKELADVPINNAGPESMGWALAGERGHQWRPTSPAAVMYVEPLDQGNPAVSADYRDRVMVLEAPFDGEPRELMRTADRIVSASDDLDGSDLFAFADNGRQAIVKQFAWATRGEKVWLANVMQPASQPRLLWSHNADDWYSDPGSPVTKAAQGGAVLRQNGDWIYLAGQGGSPDGDHPFLDRFNLKTLKSERVFATSGASYESVVAVLDDQAKRLITRYETSLDPANYMLRDLAAKDSKPLTNLPRPEHALRYSSKQLVNYVRSDGVPLSGTLYLPPNYKKGNKVPAIVWAYPREYASKSGAGQVRGSPYRYSGRSNRVSSDYMLFLTQGYAVLANAAMPIVGGLKANDTYVEQLVANAQAAVDMLVDQGVTDRKTVGVAGHSYGAFMTANLLAHSDIFAAGYALSGAYNRTLTPFGFQRERRTYWQAPEVYQAMSPFMHVTDINEPILLFHGEIDSNTGTYPIQSQRFFHALKGVGATAKLEMLPYEDHAYAARESRLHVLAESFDWFDQYVKNAK
ncbi:S9 family peptidase [Altererythrobacter sp. FM1]|uniref:S9 family peptidase n=1 Tax=Tsuneonella flava TaxID=2055955 RepID=UPI000C7FA29C|nr:prolyl oligopeptidase family serine peptidase [Tsuneonella flava]ROT97397.1 S9 family peptidase [Altererythrobacter sp. FM1]